MFYLRFAHPMPDLDDLILFTERVEACCGYPANGAGSDGCTRDVGFDIEDFQEATEARRRWLAEFPDATVTIRERSDVRTLREQGEADIEAGRVHDHEDVKRELGTDVPPLTKE